MTRKVSDWDKDSITGWIRVKVLGIWNKARKTGENFPELLEDEIFEALKPEWETIDGIVEEKLDEQVELVKAETYTKEEYEKLDKENDNLCHEIDGLKAELKAEREKSPKIRINGMEFAFDSNREIFISEYGYVLKLEPDDEICGVARAWNL